MQRVEQQMVKEDEKDKHERAKLREQQVPCTRTLCVLYQYCLSIILAFANKHERAEASRAAGHVHTYGERERDFEYIRIVSVCANTLTHALESTKLTYTPHIHQSQTTK